MKVCRIYLKIAPFLCENLQVPGIYHISFTGLFHALQGHGLNADIILNRNGKETPLGRSSADTNEKATFLTEGNTTNNLIIFFASCKMYIVKAGRDDDIYVTSTIIVMERLRPRDQIFVQVEFESGHGQSKLHSTDNKEVFFVGQKIGYS